MCGIAGLFDHGATIGTGEEASRAVRAMAATLIHRGPDGDGLFSDPQGRCVLGHRRLSVIDRSAAGRQPMMSADGRWVVVCNGEVYNFQELRPLLQREGIVLRGRSDTEVLVNSIALWQTGALPRLDGMFAFAAFDTQTGELLLARDPFGEKPLYYVELPRGGLAFASELQALETLPGFDAEVSVDAMAEVLMFQYVGAPRTIYRSVRKLPPGHWLRAAPGQGFRIHRYYSFPAETGEPEERSVGDLADELEEILVRSIRRRLVADVPVGAFISGGVDSSTVCALARNKLGRPLKTFTLGFAGNPESEHQTARSFAEHLGLEHHARMLVPADTAILPEIGAWLDEPSADWSCLPVYLLSKLAREHVTVALSGDGGDEMFAGYSWYFPPLETERTASGSAVPWRADPAYTAGLLMTGESVIAELFGGLPTVLAERLEQIRAQINQPSPGLAFRLRRNEVENYLPGAVLAKVDRMSMRHSLEVRTPFLQTELALFAARLPARALYGSGRGKLVLREVAYRHLPRELIDLPKRGFGLPGPDWGGAEIRSGARQLLLSEESRLRLCLGREILHAFVQRDSDTHQLWTLAMLESWLRHHRVTLPEARGQDVQPRAS
jgi:asparagine synthase (glutamine-hydrolysing)